MPSTSTSITIGGVQCWDEEISEEFTRTTARVTRTIRCSWGDRGTLIGYLRGGANQIGNFYIYTNPQAAPGYSWLYTDEVTVARDGAKSQDGSGIIAGDYAVLTVTYTPLIGTQTGAIGLDFGKEIIALPDNSLKFADGSGEPVPGAKAKVIAVIGITQAKLNAASLPISAIIAASAAPLDNSGLFGSSTGTLLFDGGRALRKFTTAGVSNWDIEFRFLCRPALRWDYMYDSTGVARQVVSSTGGAVFYTSSNLNALYN